MTNDFRMSYFMPPIAPIKDEHGQLVTPTQLRRYTDGKSITITIRDSLWYILASQQQMPHRSFPPNSSRYRLSHLLSGSSGDA